MPKVMDNAHESLSGDERTLKSLGYEQELSRNLSGFSNLALSLSIICILAGGLTSFSVGFCSVGGAAIGLGWPVCCLFSLVVAATMAQLASAFPTAGGLYHWSAILGGRGWGWATAWFNLAGLITVLAAINVGTCDFLFQAFFPGEEPVWWLRLLTVALVTGSHGLFNHLGIRVTTRLVDFSGYWILFVSAALTLILMLGASTWDWSRLVTITNFSGLPVDGPIWPKSESVGWLFLLGLLLPAYTITGFDASAHVSEETKGAAQMVPRGIVRSVLFSGIAGWIMLISIVLAIPDVQAGAEKGAALFFWTMRSVVPPTVAALFFGGIVIAQYLCGLATVTSASRMAYAFARDGGLPFSNHFRKVDPSYKTPVSAIWGVSALAVLFTLYTPVYSTITVVCTIFIYISYVLPVVIGLFAYGRTWTKMGPWQLGVWFRPCAVLAMAGCAVLIVVGMQPPNDKALIVVGGMCVLMVVAWTLIVRHRFSGPPGVISVLKAQAEAASNEVSADGN